MAKVEIVIGSNYNNYNVLGQCDHKASNGEKVYKCRCICGTVRNVQKSNLGKVLGCGCVRSVYAPRAISFRPVKNSSIPKKSTIKKPKPSNPAPITTKTENKKPEAKPKNDFDDFDNDDDFDVIAPTPPSKASRYYRVELENKLEDLRQERLLREFDYL